MTDLDLAGVFDDGDVATRGDALTLSASAEGSPSWLTVALSGSLLRLTPAPDASGTATIVVRATDRAGNTGGSATYSWTILAQPGPPAPPGTPPPPAPRAAPRCMERSERASYSHLTAVYASPKKFFPEKRGFPHFFWYS